MSWSDVQAIAARVRAEEIARDAREQALAALHVAALSYASARADGRTADLESGTLRAAARLLVRTEAAAGRCGG